MNRVNLINKLVFNFEFDKLNYNLGLKWISIIKTQIMLGSWTFSKPTFSFNCLF